MSDTLTITLTSRAPVTIKKDDWDVIARASCHDGKVECQANRTTRITVRQHADGRTIVYGVYDTCYQGERGIRRGRLLPGRDVDAIVDAIHRVADGIGAPEGLAEECVADLPAEDI